MSRSKAETSTSGFLIDTNVLSEGSKRLPAANYLAWLEHSDDTILFTSCLTLGEGLRGVQLIKDPAKRRQLAAYWYDIHESFTDKILPIDIETCRLWANLSAAASKQGHTAPLIDSLLAAQALQHNLTLVTRNLKDFEQFAGLALVSPWN